LTEKKLNKWKISTFVLLILLVIVVATSGSTPTFTTGNAVATDTVEFINTNLLQGGAEAELTEVTTESGMYKASMNIDGQPLDVYITKDGNYMFPSAIPMKTVAPTNTDADAAAAAPQGVTEVTTKADKPTVDLFIMSHCPFGTQAEKGMLPVAKALKDDIDFNIKFVYYAMHPTQGEVEEQLNQYCIQEEQNDKFLDYLECFLTDGDGEGCLDEIGIDKTALTTCTEAADEEFEITKNLDDTSLWLNGRFPLFNTHAEENQMYGVGGSPTLVINGQKIDGAPRDAANLLDTVCSGFNMAPEKCNTLDFDSTTPSSGFGWGAAASANVAACGA
jgi:protein-disulfide isomerase